MFTFYFYQFNTGAIMRESHKIRSIDQRIVVVNRENRQISTGGSKPMSNIFLGYIQRVDSERSMIAWCLITTFFVKRTRSQTCSLVSNCSAPNRRLLRYWSPSGWQSKDSFTLLKTCLSLAHDYFSPCCYQSLKIAYMRSQKPCVTK